MSFRRLISGAAATAAHATRRLSSGLVFLAGGLMNLEDHRRTAAGCHENSPHSTADAESGLNPAEEQAYQLVVRPGGRLCVIGCGTGRDVLPFVARGHEVVAVEPEGDAVATLNRLLRARRQSAQIIHGYAEDVAFPGLFDAIILSPHCYGNIPGAFRRVALLEKLKSHLGLEGRLAINYLPRPAPMNTGGLRIAALAATLTRSDCPWEPNDIVQLVHGPRGRYILYEHYFLPQEVQHEAERAGLRSLDGKAGPLPALAIVGCQEPGRQ